MTKEQLHSFICETQPNICQVAAFSGGKKVYSDEWNGYKPDDCTHIMSATKSIVALLVGIAVDRGEIGSVDDRVLGCFPEYDIVVAVSSYFKPTVFDRVDFIEEHIVPFLLSGEK